MFFNLFRVFYVSKNLFCYYMFKWLIEKWKKNCVFDLDIYKMYKIKIIILIGDGDFYLCVLDSKYLYV